MVARLLRGVNETRKIDAKTYYDWPNTYKLVRELQPNIVIWNDSGTGPTSAGGNRIGLCRRNKLELLNKTGDVPENMLRYGVENGDTWVPGR